MSGGDRLSGIRPLALILCLVFCVLLGTGVMYARYRSEMVRPVSLVPGSAGAPSVALGPDGWQMASSEYEYKTQFTIQPGSSLETPFTMVLLVSRAAPETTLAQVELDGVTYIGTAKAIPEGSLWYESFGPGQMFEFLILGTP